MKNPTKYNTELNLWFIFSYKPPIATYKILKYDNNLLENRLFSNK